METVKRFVMDTKQEENEDLTTHTKRFRQANDALKQLAGEDWMNEFVQHTVECTSTMDATEQSELKKEGPKKLVAFTCIKNG